MRAGASFGHIHVSVAGALPDCVHGAGGLLAGRPVEAEAGAARADPLLQRVVQCTVAGGHVPQRAEQAQGGHLCGQPHESHRCPGAHVRQLLLLGKCPKGVVVVDGREKEGEDTNWIHRMVDQRSLELLFN